ncbi:MAG: histidine triad nucleotide-binding protein [Clostridiales bacterium]|nr:histidine triad nucleotide-binding protein [Clostridiales bacterium]
MENCVFCRIVRGEIPAAVVYEDEEILAFKDISPKAPVHILLIPKKHLSGLSAMEEEDAALFGRLNYLAAQIAKEQGIAESGYRLVTNCGRDSGQEVFHIHFHLIGGRFLGSFFGEQLT